MYKRTSEKIRNCFVLKKIKIKIKILIDLMVRVLCGHLIYNLESKNRN